MSAADPASAPAPTDWYAPNQQAVRGDDSGPAEEGDGGSAPVDGTGGISPDEPQDKTPAEAAVDSSLAAADAIDEKAPAE